MTISTTNAGVCAGFAEYFEMDVTLMRIIFLALLVMHGGHGPAMHSLHS